MLKGKWKLLISIALVACVIFIASNDLFAAINQEYYDTYVKNNEVTDFNLDKKVQSSTLLDALGILIYAVGSIMEFILGKVFSLITGAEIFPWADAILFNAIPFLDINVFAPSEASLVSEIQGFISGTYYTVLMLASTFFGIAVMVSAIRLVLTAIAEDKATYKKAIVDWLLGLIMLWGVHFFISFVLYLNEELVYSASKMVSTMMADPETQNITQISYDEEEDKKVTESFIAAMKSLTITDFVKGVLGEWAREWVKGLFFDYSVSESEEILRDNPTLTRRLLFDERYTDWAFGEYSWFTILNFNAAADSTDFMTWKAGDKTFIQRVAEDIQYTKSHSYEDIMDEYEEKVDDGARQEELDFYQALLSVRRSSVDNEEADINVITNLAIFFKESSWSTEENAWRPNKAVVQYAILYAILVAQSLVFFIAYAKRLFYVILLILMAPIVVVFDFFTRTTK